MACLQGITSIARIVATNPWEDDKKCIEIDDTHNPPQIKSILASQRSKAQFDLILQPHIKKSHHYHVVVKPLCDAVISGTDSTYISYGQAATGKTKILIGDSKNNHNGLISMATNQLLNTPNVTSLFISILECYGKTGVSKMKIFDLLNLQNKTDEWSEKKPMITRSAREINTMEDITMALQDSSQSAHTIQRKMSQLHAHRKVATYQSNRGHVMYILRATVKNENHLGNHSGNHSEKSVAYLSFLDLAGSDNWNANELNHRIRKSESKCLHMASIRIHDWLKRAFQYKSGIEQGQRSRLLYERGGVVGMGQILSMLFDNEKQKINVVFSISPSFSNVNATRGTLRFAVLKRLSHRSRSRSVSISPEIGEFTQYGTKIREEIQSKQRRKHDCIDINTNLLNEIKRLKNVVEVKELEYGLKMMESESVERELKQMLELKNQELAQISENNTSDAPLGKVKELILNQQRQMEELMKELGLSDTESNKLENNTIYHMGGLNMEDINLILEPVIVFIGRLWSMDWKVKALQMIHMMFRGQTSVFGSFLLSGLIVLMGRVTKQMIHDIPEVSAGAVMTAIREQSNRMGILEEQEINEGQDTTLPWMITFMLCCIVASYCITIRIY